MTGEIKEMADAVIDAVKNYVDARLAKLNEAVERRLSEIPAGKDGKDGLNGKDGVNGPKGEPGSIGGRGPQGEKGEAGAPGERGPGGEVGPSGKDGAPGERGVAGEKGESGAAGERGPQGETGLTGKDGFPGERGAQGEKGFDGLPGADGQDGQDGRDGNDGPAGRDALQIEPLKEIDPDAQYPRGTYASHRGGLIRAARLTEPITDGLEKAGWDVLVEGVADINDETKDDGRLITRTTTLTSGRKYTHTHKTAAMIYRGIWAEGEYSRGDVVTRDSSLWTCTAADTKATPGQSPDWKLSVRKGAPGKDASSGNGAAGPGVVRLR